MKKKNLWFILLVLLGGILSICFLINSEYLKKRNKMDRIPGVDTDSSEQINLHKNKINSSEVSKQIKMEVILEDAGKIKITIHNDSDYEITAGEAYQIQKQNNGVWEDIPLSIVWNDLGIPIPSKESHSFESDLNSVLDLNEAGTYRIIKTVSTEQNIMELTTDFTISDGGK